MRITFGMIVLNGRPFVEYNLRALYPFAHQIVVVEGAVPASRAAASPTGHSRDGTLEVLRTFKRNEDPEGRVTIVTAEDENYRDGFWTEKEEMSQAYAKRATGDYLWQIDADEFYRPEDMQRVIDLLSSDREIKTVSFPMHTFWGRPDCVVGGFFLETFSASRIFAWGGGYEYSSHRPPTVINDKGIDLRTLKGVTAAQMRRRGVHMFHYELLFPDQVLEKCRYYSSVGWSSELRSANEWAAKCYLSLTKPFRVHMMCRHLSWLERFSGVHPPRVRDMLGAVEGGQEGVTLRRTDDIESLLSNRAYRVQREILKAVVPVNRRLKAAKGASRRLFGNTPVWRLLQNVKRRLRGQAMPLAGNRVNARLVRGWQARSIPRKQRTLTAKELAAMYTGATPLPYQVLAESVKSTGADEGTIVEVGCSTAYHYEVLSHLLHDKVRYVGIDYSYPMIAEARRCYRAIPLIVADATALPYRDGSFDVLISGCCVLHIPNYSKVISESARVARRWIIFHRTPIVEGKTTYYRKRAYGVPCLEIHFNEHEFVGMCLEEGLHMHRAFDISASDNSLYKTYVFAKPELV